MWTRILPAVLAGGVGIAGLTLWSACSSRRALRHVRWAIAALAVYGAGSFVAASILGIGLRAALRGEGPISALPSALQGGFLGGFVVLPLGWMASVIRGGIPRFRGTAPRPVWYQAVALTTCVALLFTSLEIRGFGEKHLDSKNRVALLNNGLRALEDGEREMPRDTWDPDYVVRMVGRNPQKIFRWVQQNTYWIPYHGQLRGPTGVLMDRQGNSLDRAILLATLLEKAGQTVRLAHGELPPEEAKNRLPELVAARELAFHQNPKEQIAGSLNLQPVLAQYGFEDSSIGEVLSNSAREVAKFSAEIRARANRQSIELLRVVNRPPAAAEWAQRYDAAVSALCDHWWVQQLQDGNWIDRDLLQESRKSGAALTAPQTTAAIADLAADLRHQIAVRVICEQVAHGKLTEHTALEHVVPLADLVEQPVVLKFWPVDWVSDAGQAQMPTNDFRKAVLAQEKWVAALGVGRKLVTGGFVLANGDDSKAPRKGGAMGGLADAFASTMGVNRKDENRQLSALWIEYEIRVPGQKPRTLRRNVFDLIGPAKRASASTAIEMDDSKRLTRGLAMLMRTEMLPVSCRFSPEFLMHLASQSLMGNHAIVDSALRGDFEATAPSGEALLEHMSPVVSRLYSVAEARIEWAADPDSMFVSEPQLLTSHSYAVPKGDHIAFRDATDIVANNFGVSLAVRDGFAARLRQGVLDTNVEAQVQLETRTFGNAADAYAKSGSWAHVINAEQAKALNLPSDYRQRISDDVSSGYDVVAPQRSVPMPVEDFSGWWRIDRSSGTALGMGANGWGATVAEHEATDARAVEQEPRFIRMMTAAREGFLSGYSLCVALKAYEVVKEDRVIVYEHLHATLSSGSTQRECLVDGIVSAVLSLFIVTMGPIIDKWLTRSFPLAARAGKWLAGTGDPILGGNGGGPPEPAFPAGGGGDEPCPSIEASGGGAPEPAPKISLGEPESPQQFAQQIAAQDARIADVEAELNAAKARTQQARDAADALENKYEQLKDAGAPKKQLDDLAMETMRADKAKGALLQEEVNASNRLAIEQKVGANLKRIQAANQTAWDAQQKMTQAYQALTDWENSHNAEGLFDTPEWKNYYDTLQEYRNAQRRLQYAYGGGECGEGGAKPQPDLSKPQPDLSKSQPDLSKSQPDLSKTQPDLGKTQPDLGKTQPDLGKTQPDLGKTQPDLGKTQPDLGKTAPGTTSQVPGSQPGSPPTQRSPQGGSGPSGPSSGSDEPIPPTEPGGPPTRQGPPDPGAPPTQRSPQNAPAPVSPAQKTLTGIGGVMGALGGK